MGPAFGGARGNVPWPIVTAYERSTAMVHMRGIHPRGGGALVVLLLGLSACSLPDVQIRAHPDSGIRSQPNDVTTQPGDAGFGEVPGEPSTKREGGARDGGADKMVPDQKPSAADAGPMPQVADAEDAGPQAPQPDAGSGEMSRSPVAAGGPCRNGEATAWGPCDPVSQCGCGPGEHCLLRTTNGKNTSFCGQRGTAPGGAYCDDSQDCGEGVGCVSGVCALLCDPSREDCACSDDGSCKGYCAPSAGDYGFCFPFCDFAANSGCVAGQVCAIAFETRRTVCLVPNDADSCTRNDGNCDGPSGTRQCARDIDDAADCCASPADCCPSGCCPSIPDAECDPIAQCGCADGLRCQATRLNGRMTAKCSAPGDVPIGARCQNTQSCVGGANCVNGLCLPYCDLASEQCGCDPAGDVSCAGYCFSINAPGVGACFRRCDFDANTGCPSDQVCSGIFDATGVCTTTFSPEACPKNNNRCDGPSGTRLCASDDDDAAECAAPP